jgi:regulation of enolase protein 1 (concanavalin A-like superfamily)
MSDVGGERTQLIQRQVELVLDSPEFAGSHRLSDFLRFVCKAAADGRTEVDQVEIAKAVLGRGDDFSPTEDTSVRKLATTARQRLERYYAEHGKLDPVVILLPQRSYLPRFRFVDQSEPHSAEPRSRFQAETLRRLLAGGLIGVSVLLLAALSFHYGRRWPSPQLPAGQFTVPARKGSIIFGRTDAPPESLLVGAAVGATDQVIARMIFSPRTQYDQAGIMIFDDVDNYVRLARHLRRRTSFHFTAEIRGIRSVEPDTFVEDPLGQTGEPVWLAIRRNGQEFHAFTSTDGWHWSRMGHVVKAPLSTDKARVALYAFSDAEADPPPIATFDRVNVGPPMANWGDDSVPLGSIEEWKEVNGCQSEVVAVPKPDQLEIDFSQGTQGCRWNLIRRMPPGDWSLTAMVESCSWARNNAGVVVAGDSGELYIIRNDWQGGSIVATTHKMRLFRGPDFPGSPPLFVRVRKLGDVLRAEVGTNLHSFNPLPFEYDVRKLGGNLRAGLDAARDPQQRDTLSAPIGFRLLGLDAVRFEKYR